MKILAIIASLLATTAFSQSRVISASSTLDQTLTSDSDEIRSQARSIELMPLVTLVSAVPGVSGSGLSFEQKLGKKFAVFVDGAYSDIDLAQRWVSSANDETNEPIPESGYGFSTSLGLRYYEDPIGDSFYTGGSMNYSEAHHQWTLNEETYDVDSFAAMPTLFAGYRWIWNNGTLFRLGGGIGMPKVDSLTVSAAESNSSSEGQEKISDIVDQSAVAKLDMGLGYTF